MNIEKKYAEMKLDIQTIDVKMNPYLERKIDNLIKKLLSFNPDINWMEIYMKCTNEENRTCNVVVRLSIAGNDFQATDTGDRWKIILKNVEKRLLRQMEKRKSLMLKMAS